MYHNKEHQPKAKTHIIMGKWSRKDLSIALTIITANYYSLSVCAFTLSRTPLSSSLTGKAVEQGPYLHRHHYGTFILHQSFYDNEEEEFEDVDCIGASVSHRDMGSTSSYFNSLSDRLPDNKAPTTKGELAGALGNYLDSLSQQMEAKGTSLTSNSNVDNSLKEQEMVKSFEQDCEDLEMVNKGLQEQEEEIQVNDDESPVSRAVSSYLENSVWTSEKMEELEHDLHPPEEKQQEQFDWDDSESSTFTFDTSLEENEGPGEVTDMMQSVGADWAAAYTPGAWPPIGRTGSAPSSSSSSSSNSNPLSIDYLQGDMVSAVGMPDTALMMNVGSSLGDAEIENEEVMMMEMGGDDEGNNKVITATKTSVETEAVVDHTVDAEEYVGSLNDAVEDMKREEDKARMESGTLMRDDIQTPFPPDTRMPPSPPEEEVTADDIASATVGFDNIESSWSVSDAAVVEEEEEEIISAKKSFVPTPPETPPPLSTLALEDEDDEDIMLIQEEEEPPKSADQSISMNLGSTAESTLGSNRVGKYVNVREKLRDTQYRAQKRWSRAAHEKQRAAEKIERLQRAMEREKAKVESELKKKMEEAQQKIVEEVESVSDLLRYSIGEEEQRENQFQELLDNLQFTISSKESDMKSEASITAEMASVRSKIKAGTVATQLDALLKQRLQYTSIERDLVQDLYSCVKEMESLLVNSQEMSGKMKDVLERIVHPDITKADENYEWSDVDEMEDVLDKAAANVAASDERVMTLKAKLDRALVKKSQLLQEPIPDALKEVARKVQEEEARRKEWTGTPLLKAVNEDSVTGPLTVIDTHSKQLSPKVVPKISELKSKSNREVFGLLGISMAKASVEGSKATIYGMKALLDGITATSVAEASGEAIKKTGNAVRGMVDNAEEASMKIKSHEDLARAGKDAAKSTGDIFGSLGKAGTAFVANVGKTESAMETESAFREASQDLVTAANALIALGIKGFAGMQKNDRAKSSQLENEAGSPWLDDDVKKHWKGDDVSFDWLKDED